MKSFLLTLPLAVVLTSCSAPCHRRQQPGQFSQHQRHSRREQQFSDQRRGQAMRVLRALTQLHPAIALLTRQSEGMPGPVVEAAEKSKGSAAAGEHESAGTSRVCV
jgi:hypothetical protein